jgi:hypothetical protein
MNSNRRGIILAMAAAGALAVSGCASTQHPPHTYKETISSVLLSSDNKHLVAIGSNHHYVFDAPAPLVAALHASLHPRLSAEFSTFNVDPQSTITGEYTLVLEGGLAPEEQTAAEELGFARGPDGRWLEQGRLAGRRYTGWTYKTGEHQEKLNKPYTIEITVEARHGDAIVDSLDTPIRVTADGVQMLYFLPLAPVIIPVIFLTAAKDH